jgi:putative addiction module killer protein
VENSPRESRIYTMSSGSRPFSDWLKGLRDLKGRATIRVRLDRLEQGNFGNSEPAGEGVRELKIDFGPGYRVYFAEDGPKIVLLLLGGDKKSQKKDIKTAKRYWEDYRRRKDD